MHILKLLYSNLEIFMKMDFFSFLDLSPQAPFHTLGSSMMTIFVMTLGEMNYHDNFLPWDNLAFATLTNVLFIILVLGMPIIMMNMLVRKRTLHHYRVPIRKDFIDFCAVRFNPFEQRLRFEFPKFQEMRNGT